MGETLSKASPYEMLFKARRRSVGRPADDREPLFASVQGGREPSAIVSTVAKRRAYAVVHEEQRDRLQEVYLAELRVLSRRGDEVVARDAGVRPGVGKVARAADRRSVEASAEVVDIKTRRKVRERNG